MTGSGAARGSVAPAGALREGGRGATAGRARLRWRQSLVATEVALAVVLVVAVVRPRCVRVGMIRWGSVVVVLPRRVRMAITL